ncbi:MAG TPA: rod shape-determining protein RodA, partial [Candidatus Cryptobacteroides sp.]|nr:rod shape-determining protein RodA [Candidatus Cryptobacteroides sp.]
MNKKIDRGLGKTVDWQLVFYYLLLVFIGWVSIYASIHSSEPSGIFAWGSRSGKQFIWMLTSFGIAALILFVINPRLWEVISVPAYFVVGFLLVAVIFVGSEVKGSHSWFQFGPVSFQPAEISKITTSLMLATLMSKSNFSFNRRKDFWRVMSAVLIPMLIIVAESETGSALVYVGFMFAMFREGLSGWYLVIILAAIILFILTLKTSVWVALIVVGVAALIGLLIILRNFRPRSRERRRALPLLFLGVAGTVIMTLSTSFVFDKVLAEHQR